MTISRILIGSATLALGTMLAWGAPATGPAAVTAPLAQAPGGGRRMMSPSAMAKMQTDRLDQAVKLTPEQKTKVQAIYEKAAGEMQAARQSGDMSSMRQIMTKEQADVKAVLTPEQQKKMPAPGMGGRRGGRMGGGMNMGGGQMGGGMGN